MSDNKYVLGADIGGSHITVAILDIESRSILQKSLTRKAVNSKAPLGQIMHVWCEAIADACVKVKLSPQRVGIAMPGPFDYEKGISFIKGNNKYDALYGLNVKEILAIQLGLKSNAISLKNDAASFLAGEVFAGSARDYQKVIGVTLGTGLGSAVYNGTEVYDANLWCAPYLDTIAEDYISTRWFLKRYHQLTGLNILNVKDLTALYTESATIRLIFDEFAIHLADFLENFQLKTRAEAIVIGGNIAKAADKFMPVLSRQLKKRKVKQPVLISANTELAAIAGAASSWQSL